MSGGLPGARLPTIARCLIDKLPHTYGYHGGVRYCRCDEDVTYVYGLTPCHEPVLLTSAASAAESGPQIPSPEVSK